MTVIEASSVRVQTMADNTLRLTVDIEPRFANDAFALFGKAGQPMALAALKPASSKPEKPEPERQPVGELCRWAAMRCGEPPFIAWIADAHPRLWAISAESDGGPHAADDIAAQVVRDLCGVASRRELDTNEGAAALLHKHIRLPYAAWLKKGPR